MSIPFIKMHGLGNDFIVLDQREQDYALTPERVRAMSDRRLGIGCDQLLVVERAVSSEADLHCRIFNADGQEVAQCGNGMRCLVRYVIEQGMVPGPTVRLSTIERVMQGSWEGGDQVSVDMGLPHFDPAAIPFTCSSDEQPPYHLTGEGHVADVDVVAVGNPHAVIRVEQHEAAHITAVGAWLSTHPAFPEGVNVGFMQVLSPQQIALQVYERGAGQTQACGSGACAAVVVGRRAGVLAASVQVDQPGGRLLITWEGEGHAIQMVGPTAVVYNGIYADVFS